MEKIPFKGEDQHFGIMFVVYRREDNGGKTAGLKPKTTLETSGEDGKLHSKRVENSPVNGGGVDCHGVFTTEVGPILQVVVLPLLLLFEPEAKNTLETSEEDAKTHSKRARNT